MRHRACILGLLMMLGRAALDAQTTADGVEAFVNRDYQNAAKILKPIAEHAQPPDHVAEFFMATLYMNGQGAEEDAVQACALYVRASKDSGQSLFALQA